jgi:hypothetical protein
MRRRAVPFLVAVALAAGIPAAGAAEGAGAIQGRVTAASGAPLADVCVDALGLDQDAVGATETGPDGRYELAALPAGTWVIGFTDCDPSPAYVAHVVEGVTVADEGTTTLDAALVAGGVVTGTVRDGTGTATGGICVHVVVRDGGDLVVAVSGSSSRDGSFRVGPVEPGDVLVAFADCRSKPSLVGQFLGGTTDPASARPVTVTSGGTAGADVTLATGATISGRVDDGTGAPHRGACLAAAPPGAADLVTTAGATSGADGTFTLGGLAPGTYRVLAGLCAGTDEDAVEVTVAAGEPRSGLSLTVPASHVARRAGRDRVATALAVAGDLPSPTILLAGDRSPVDVLAAAPLAASLDAPLLLTPRDALPASVRGYVEANHVTDAVILGGTAAVSPAVERALATAGIAVDRVAGVDRYATAAAIAGRLDASSAYLVADDDWPDAVAVGTLAALEGRPILLAGRHRLPDATAEVIGGMASVDLVGGPGALGDDVAAAVATTVPHVGRLGGTDRFDTSARVARLGAAEGLPWTSAWVTSGRSWADGVVAAVAAARGGGPLLLLGPTAPSLLAAHGDDLASLTVVGGTGQVPAATYQRLAAIPAASCAATDRC